jgi:hypothetical protein
MTPKKVWSVILIVMGVLSVIVSAASYKEFEVAGDVATAINASSSKLLEHSSFKTSKINDVQGMMKPKNMLSFIGIFLGVLLSVIGTFMIKETKPNHTYDLNLEPFPIIEDDIETEIINERPFIL